MEGLHGLDGRDTLGALKEVEAGGRLDGFTGTLRDPATGARTRPTIRECNRIIKLIGEGDAGSYRAALTWAREWHFVNSDHYPSASELSRIIAGWCYRHSDLADVVRLREHAPQGAYFLPPPPPRPATVTERVAAILLEEAAVALALWGVGWLTRLVSLGRTIRRLEEAVEIARIAEEATVVTKVLLAERRIRRLETEEELLEVLRGFFGLS